MSVNLCNNCLDKQLKIDRLTEENQSLRSALSLKKREAKGGIFGSSTPSSQIPVKPNTGRKNGKRGAPCGHKGHGRDRVAGLEVFQEMEVELPEQQCPHCHCTLAEKGSVQRDVLESEPLQVRRRVYHLQKKYCPRCRRSFKAKAPGVLPRSLYGNRLIATAATMHYLHGIALGRIGEQLGIGSGALCGVLHRLSRLFSQVPERLIKQYRLSPVKHADETGWRVEGNNCYAWLFATPELSIFQFGKSRSARVALAVFGEGSVPGVLVVDRYNGYNKVPCQIQYCYAHLLRKVCDLEKEFPDSGEVSAFVGTVSALLSEAMGLRSSDISDEQFRARAAELKVKIIEAMGAPASHLGIVNIQEIFSRNEHRLYHWADDRAVPADNNLAERDLRPSVIARKVSFGSASDAGAKTRSTLTTVVQSLRKQGYDVSDHLKAVLDKLADDIKQDPFAFLFPGLSP